MATGGGITDGRWTVTRDDEQVTQQEKELALGGESLELSQFVALEWQFALYAHESFDDEAALGFQQLHVWCAMSARLRYLQRTSCTASRAYLHCGFDRLLQLLQLANAIGVADVIAYRGC